MKDEEKSTFESVSAEEIARVKLEWEEEQKKKAEKSKEKEKRESKVDNGVVQQTDKDEKKEGFLKSPSSTPPTSPTHERYILHRSIFTS